MGYVGIVAQRYELFSRFRRFVTHKFIVFLLGALYAVIAGDGVSADPVSPLL